MFFNRSKRLLSFLCLILFVGIELLAQDVNPDLTVRLEVLSRDNRYLFTTDEPVRLGDAEAPQVQLIFPEASANLTLESEGIVRVDLEKSVLISVYTLSDRLFSHQMILRSFTIKLPAWEAVQLVRLTNDMVLGFNEARLSDLAAFNDAVETQGYGQVIKGLLHKAPIELGMARSIKATALIEEVMAGEPSESDPARINMTVDRLYALDVVDQYQPEINVNLIEISDIFSRNSAALVDFGKHIEGLDRWLVELRSLDWILGFYDQNSGNPNPQRTIRNDPKIVVLPAGSSCSKVFKN